jgi:hypothetical protein
MFALNLEKHSPWPEFEQLLRDYLEQNYPETAKPASE